jgi:hypothetical protein
MPWIARKSMTLGAESVPKGGMVPQRLLESIPPGRFGSLVRIGYLQEVTVGHATAILEDAPKQTSDTEDGDHCTICGGGPYVRINQHISQMHKE